MSRRPSDSELLAAILACAVAVGLGLLAWYW